MELNAFHRVPFMAKTHNDAGSIRLTRAGTYLKVLGQTFFRNDERMITGGGQRIWCAAKDGLAVVFHTADFAVHNFAGAHDLSSEGCPDRLMSQANTEHRFFAGEILQQFDAD